MPYGHHLPASAQSNSSLWSLHSFNPLHTSGMITQLLPSWHANHEPQSEYKHLLLLTLD